MANRQKSASRVQISGKKKKNSSCSSTRRVVQSRVIDEQPTIVQFEAEDFAYYFVHEYLKFANGTVIPPHADLYFKGTNRPL